MKLKLLFLFFFGCIAPYTFSQITLVYGSYTGTGSSRNILGIGFTPAAVFIKGGSNGVYIKSSSMGGANSRLWANNGGLVTNAITGFIADGFSLGTIAGVNAVGTTYYFVAMSSSFPGLKTGSYTGNGGGTQNIAYSSGTNRGLFTVVIPAASGGGAVACVDGTAYHYGYNSSGGSGNGSGSGGLPASGFQVYSGFNGSGATYHYISFINSAGVANGNSYSGNGTDNRNYTGLGVTPSSLFIFKGGDTDVSWKNNSLAGDNTMVFTATTTGINRIQAFIANGFQLGNNPDVNEIGSTYYYMGFGGAAVSALPIELFHFDVQCGEDQRSMNVHWTTASETNNDYFTIEKSEDGVHFTPIGMVKGAGNSNTTIDYLFTDNEINSGVISYYRLKQTDFDGKNETFSTVAGNCDRGNPSTFELTLQTNPINESSVVYNFDYNRDGLVTAHLYNSLGKEIDKTTFYHRSGFNTYYRSLPDLEPGVYFFSISDGINKQTVKLIKQ